MKIFNFKIEQLFSPLAGTFIIIFTIEFVLMFIFDFLKLPRIWENFLDASILTLIAGTLIYIFITQPLVIKNVRSELEWKTKNTYVLQKLEALDQSMICSVTDIYGNIKYVNQNFENISGYTSLELVGKNHNIVNSGFHSKSFFVDLWQTISLGKSWKGEIQNKKKNGDRYWVNTTIVPIVDSDGEILEFVSLRYDITKKKELFEKLEIAKREADLATAAKTEFLAHMSHEIRTPLNLILGIPDLLLETEMTNEQKNYIEIFQRSGTNLLNILNDVLDLTKIESKKMELEMLPFRIEDSVNIVVETVKYKVTSKGLTLNTYLNPQIQGKYNGDSKRLNQILLNLIGNALKFTNKGEINLQVTTNYFKDKMGNVLFTVADTGIGCTKEEVDKLFVDFTQGNSSIASKYGGTGLGLIICKQLVEKMGGQIWVESLQGKGTTFFFTINLETTDAVILSSTLNTNEIKSERALKILLVDDSEDNLFLLKEFFKKTNHEIVFAENGEIANQLFRENKFDIIFMDLQMPVMDGILAVKMMRDFEKNMKSSQVPIYALTANNFSAVIEECISAGFTDFLSKPVLKKTILGKVSKYYQA